MDRLNMYTEQYLQYSSYEKYTLNYSRIRESICLFFREIKYFLIENVVLKYPKYDKW